MIPAALTAAWALALVRTACWCADPLDRGCVAALAAAALHDAAAQAAALWTGGV